MKRLSRREFAFAGASLAASVLLPGHARARWASGDVAHILPTASDTEFLVKVSFTRAFIDGVTLGIDGKRVAGERTDTEGRFWRFRACNLVPDRLHQLRLHHRGRPLCDSWPLRTFPSPDADTPRLRLLAYTCAGGLEGARSIGGVEAFRSLAIRQRLLDRALTFSPDAVIANGDHIYWDQRAWLEHPHPEIRRLTREVYDRFGYFDRATPVLGGPNEALLKRLADPQIAKLYGTRFRSIPCFFVQDDHDYFENDDATETFVTFPPDQFQVAAARAVQKLYYPEFLPDARRPVRLSGASAPEHGLGVSECFGTLRAGRLLEANLFDCGRFLSLKGRHAGLIPDDAEAWLLERTRAEDTRHYLQVPSHPMGWTAGKWREWYPDVLADESEGAGDAVVSTHREGAAAPAEGQRLSVKRSKFMWQSGWFAQHQRLASALSSQRKRTAVMVSGDLHAVGRGLILRSGDADFAGNPIHTILSGPIGTSHAGWPSFARGTAPQPSSLITLSQDYAPAEKNGFTLIDVEPDRMVFRLFAWREPDSVEAIDRLESFDTVVVKSRS